MHLQAPRGRDWAGGCLKLLGTARLLDPKSELPVVARTLLRYLSGALADEAACKGSVDRTAAVT
jgi:hypothetical protein